MRVDPFRVLIVEDDAGKREQLRAQLRSSLPSALLTETTSLIGALRVLKSASFDVIILDITLPYRDNPDSPAAVNMHKLGGEEFLRQMARHKITTPVIVFTQYDTFGDEPNVKTFEQLNADIRRNFSSFYVGGVYYHASSSDWMDELDGLIKKIEDA